MREKCLRKGVANVRLELPDFVADGTGLTDGAMDVALLFNIQHHEEPVALMKEAFRILRPGGIAATSI